MTERVFGFELNLTVIEQESIKVTGAHVGATLAF